jgi:hypothetical protein
MVEHFTHKFFQRGREDLLGNIHRKTSSFAKQSSPGASSSTATKSEGGDPVAVKSTEQLLSELKEADANREQMQVRSIITVPCSADC